jgi:hypothetical protein
MDLLMEKASKKNLPASFRRYFPRQNTLCNSVSNYLEILKKIFYKIIK